MEHLSYEEYVSLGGKVDIDSFPTLLLDCEIYLDKITMSKINNTHFTPSIKRLIVKCIEVLQENNEANASISSYSDGIESISYNTTEIGEKPTESKIYSLCRLYLPPELMYRGKRGWKDAGSNNYFK
jgi:hypothetical protein|nr:MAG TPA: Head Tail Connector Protein [Caudoviricetes sp.]